MRKAEQRLWDTMRRNLPLAAWAQRIENSTAEGMPDVWVACGRVEGPSVQHWVELKAPTRPEREGTPLLGAREGLRKSQINWHLKAMSKGVRSWVLIRDDKGNLWLVSGVYAAMINRQPAFALDELAVARTWASIGRTFDAY